MHNIFSNNFFVKFKVLNYDTILSKLKSENLTNDHKHWLEYCQVDTTNLSEEYNELLVPNINHFSKILNTSFNYSIPEIWSNRYSKGYYQEIHDHIPYDISAVIFLNDGENFSQFYFADRNSCNIPHNLKRLLNISPRYNPKTDAGDIIFFPSNLLHGVSPHKSDIIRTTISFNMSLE